MLPGMGVREWARPGLGGRGLGAGSIRPSLAGQEEVGGLDFPTWELGEHPAVPGVVWARWCVCRRVCMVSGSQWAASCVSPAARPLDQEGPLLPQTPMFSPLSPQEGGPATAHPLPGLVQAMEESGCGKPEATPSSRGLGAGNTLSAGVWGGKHVSL